MTSKTEVKEDVFGMYVVAGGYRSRPFYGTCFKVGDKVKSHHFGGSTDAGVMEVDSKENFRTFDHCEIWCTSGSSNYEFTKENLNDPKFIKEATKKIKWYKKYSSGYQSEIYGEINEKFKTKLNK
jgi:hypothetical protein